MQTAPISNAKTAFDIFKNTNVSFDSANSGNPPWPSCTSMFANKMLNGTLPDKYNEINKMCGPDSGINPMRTATTNNPQRYWVTTFCNST